jgi:bifunctional UDP-N-acetylglucosamine pyrophosphorylase/glucosamine-1-phosphate N-acetyltransferase
MTELRVLIAAAGAGTRAGLPYPKTLHPVLGKPILIRLVGLLQAYDPLPVIIVSPRGREQIATCLAEYGMDAELVEQPTASGMGDAMLQFRQSTGSGSAEHLLAVWGDIPLLDARTVATLHARHFAAANDFTFVTRVVDRAYTIVERDSGGQVRAVRETRELHIEPATGERDIGLFLFRIDPVFALLEQRLNGSMGAATGEHGFLYAVEHLIQRGFKVEALPIATERDLVSLNRQSDLDAVQRFEDFE